MMLLLVIVKGLFAHEYYLKCYHSNTNGMISIYYRSRTTEGRSVKKIVETTNSPMRRVQVL